jgi:enamine deaminase RidA (YjgF/YER057c/UK114 family)
MERTRIGSGSPYESIVGFSRAVGAGHHLSVAGTAPIMPDGVEPPTDAYGQAKRCFEIIEGALHEAGAGPEHVVRTRVFLVNAADWEEVGRAHGELFADVRPANTMVFVKGLLDDRWLLEVEVDAILD